MFYSCVSMKKIGCRYVRQPIVCVDSFFLFQNPFTPVRSFKLIKTMFSQGRSGLPCEFDADLW